MTLLLIFQGVIRFVHDWRMVRNKEEKAAQVEPWMLAIILFGPPPDVSMGDIYRAIWPFVGLQAIGLIMVMIWPDIGTWLPAQMIR